MKDKIFKEFKEIFSSVFVCAFLYLILTNFVFINAVIPSESMYPELQVKDKLFCSKMINPDKLERGDIVVFKKEDGSKDLYVKRLIGTEGDVIDLKENGDVYVNGELIDEPYVQNQIREDEIYFGMQLGQYVVPENEFFFLGDNRDNSADSRYWEDPFINEDYIVAKAIFRWLPIGRFEIFK